MRLDRTRIRTTLPRTTLRITSIATLLATAFLLGGLLPVSGPVNSHNSALPRPAYAGPGLPHFASGSPPSIPVGTYPLHAAYDSENGYEYVVNSGSNNVSVINGTKVVASLAAGNTPIYATFDRGNGYVYVSNSLSPNVTVINGTKVVASVAAGSFPGDAAYDSGNGLVYVPNNGSGNVTVINGTKVVGSVTVGSQPIAVTYDRRNGYVYVENSFSNTVSVISGSTVVSTLRIPGGAGGSSPESATYDDRNGYVYIVGWGSTNITIVNGTQIVAYVSEGWYPRGSVYDPLNGFVYVPNLVDNVSVINGTKLVGTVTVGTDPFDAAFDGGNGLVYVANEASQNVSVINGTNVVGTIQVGSSPVFASYDGANGYVYVTNEGSQNVSAIPTPPLTKYGVGFAETGLPSGTNWSVRMNGLLKNSNGSTIRFTEPNGSYSFSVGSVTGYAQDVTTGTATVFGANVSVAIAYALVTYPVSFTASGLPAATSWSVNLSGISHSSNTTSISFKEPNGTFAYSVENLAAWLASPASGNVSVVGQAVSVNVSWAPAPLFSVAFVETGLKTGTAWAVTLGQATKSSTISSIVFRELSGTYPYSVAFVSGYTGGGTGNVRVIAGGVTVPVSFLAGGGLVNLTFRDSGLSTGSNWSVTLSPLSSGLTIEFQAAVTRWSNGANAITFRVSEGNYTYATSSSGYQVASGAVAVSGANPATVMVPFEPVAPATRSPGPSSWGIVAGVGIATTVFAAALVTILVSRSRDRERGRLLVARIAETEWNSGEEGESLDPIAR